MPAELSLEELSAVIADTLQIPVQTIQGCTSFTGDLGADSLDMVDVIMELEERFGVVIPEQDARGFATLDDALQFIRAQQSGQQP